MIDKVVDTIGIQIYQYLHPKDLFFLSICNHKLYNDIVHQKLAEICISHLPLHLGDGTNYLGTFREGTSFGSKAELLEYILDKTEAADLLLDDTTTAEESRRKVREEVLENDYNSCRFYPKGTTSKAFTTCVTIECKYVWEMANTSASAWVHQIINRSTFSKDKETHALIKSWIDFLFAIQNTNRHESMISFGRWNWYCKNFKLQGIAGMGVMINIQQQDGEEEYSDKIIEISFERS